MSNENALFDEEFGLDFDDTGEDSADPGLIDQLTGPVDAPYKDVEPGEEGDGG